MDGKPGSDCVLPIRGGHQTQALTASEICAALGTGRLLTPCKQSDRLSLDAVIQICNLPAPEWSLRVRAGGRQCGGEIDVVRYRIAHGWTLREHLAPAPDARSVLESVQVTN